MSASRCPSDLQTTVGSESVPRPAGSGPGSVGWRLVLAMLTLGTNFLMTASGCATTGGRSVGGQGSGGAPWTIRCVEISGPQRVQQIQQYTETLRNTPGIRAGDVFFRDEEDGQARLYYGSYRRRADPKTGKRPIPRPMQQDLDLLRSLGGPDGKRYFSRAIPSRVPQPDVGNPEWRLESAAGAYSLQVAAFEPTDDFWEYKKAAAEYCAYLRGKGYEAYFHHSAVGSEVTVGAFGADAIVRDASGIVNYSLRVIALQKDELLKYNLVNGGVIYVHDQGLGRTAVPSRLVGIPKPRPPSP